MTIAAISNGQQQASTQNLQHLVNELLSTSNKPKSDGTVEVEPQKIREKPAEDTYRPISFPSSEEDEIKNRFQAPLMSQNANLITQNVEQKLPAQTPNIELTRPTRVAVAAATSASITSRYTDDQLDYVRDFSWNMFQVKYETISCI